MKLRNKRTGEIGKLQITEKHCAVAVGNGTASCGIEIYSSLARLNEEWEDVTEEPKEPKKYWSIFYNGTTVLLENDNSQFVKDCIEVGNCFKTREEAKKAVEKLKAWKRLKDKGFRLKYWSYKMDEPKIENTTYFMIVGVCEDGVRFDDLDLLFGGEE